jgi:hypothetical protein
MHSIYQQRIGKECLKKKREGNNVLAPATTTHNNQFPSAMQIGPIKPNKGGLTDISLLLPYPPFFKFRLQFLLKRRIKVAGMDMGLSGLLA